MLVVLRAPVVRNLSMRLSMPHTMVGCSDVQGLHAHAERQRVFPAVHQHAC